MTTSNVCLSKVCSQAVVDREIDILWYLPPQALEALPSLEVVVNCLAHCLLPARRGILGELVQTAASSRVPGTRGTWTLSLGVEACGVLVVWMLGTLNGYLVTVCCASGHREPLVEVGESRC